MPPITNENIISFRDFLLKWYAINGRHFLPWRHKNLTPYQVVIAEVLLQRTKAETVAKFYLQFVIDFPNWKSLANANVTVIEKYLIPIGLYRQRSKRLTNLAIEMVKRKGKFPTEREDLESIPFMGQYIANSVELIIHKKPTPLIDVNMARLLERYFGKRKMVDIRHDSFLQGLSFNVLEAFCHSPYNSIAAIFAVFSMQ